uniref:Uncharacterized protein n=1 Tax=Helianthus annuus TaxID=4232 RepID=A0A251VAA6_HELAN
MKAKSPVPLADKPRGNHEEKARSKEFQVAKSPVPLADKPRGNHEEKARSKGTKKKDEDQANESNRTHTFQERFRIQTLC